MSQFIRFVVFAFDHHKEYFVEDHLIKMEAYAEDKAQQKTSKLRLKLKAYIVNAVDAIQPKRDDQPHNCFIKIEDEVGALNYARTRSALS